MLLCKKPKGVLLGPVARQQYLVNSNNYPLEIQCRSADIHITAVSTLVMLNRIRLNKPVENIGLVLYFYLIDISAYPRLP